MESRKNDQPVAQKRTPGGTGVNHHEQRTNPSSQAMSYASRSNGAERSRRGYMLSYRHRDYVSQILIVDAGALLIALLAPNLRKCLTQIGVDAFRVAKRRIEN